MFKGMGELKKALECGKIITVKCIENQYKWKGKKLSYQLTIGKEYEALLVEPQQTHYILVNDTQQIKLYLTKLFKKI